MINAKTFVGARSYEENDQEIFYGREKEVTELYQLICINSFTLLYGRSGLGKTSLLKAGIFPHLRKSVYFPVYFKPNYTDPKVDFIKQIELQLQDTGNSTVKVDPIKSKETLWEYFYRHPFKDSSTGKQVVPVLVFDQFEEIFTLGTKDKSSELRDNVKELVRFLADLIENSPPETINEEQRLSLQYKYASNPLPLKILFSFREEYLSNFYSLSKEIPSIAFSNLQYRLLPLSFSNGVYIIEKAGRGLFENEAIVYSIMAITEAENVDQAKERDVDSFLLSIFCESQIKSIGVDDKVTKALVERVDVQSLVNNIYEDTVKELGLNEAEVKLMENSLISEEGYRLPVYLSVALRNPNIREEKILELEGKKILKRYVVDNQHCIEIIHDKYALAVKKTSDFKKEVEQKQKQLLEEMEKFEKDQLQNELRLTQQKTLLEQQKVQQEKRLRRKTSIVASVVFVLSFFLIFILFKLNNNSVNLILKFSNDEERTVLASLEQTNSPYAAFDQAYSFYKNIHENIYSNFRLLSPRKFDRLKNSATKQLFETFNKFPFFSKTDLAERIALPLGLRIFTKTGALLIYKVQDDSVLRVDYMKNRVAGIKLYNEVNDIQVVDAKVEKGEQSLLNTKQYGAQVHSSVYNFNDTLLILTDSLLFLVDVSKKLVVRKSWLITNTGRYFYSPNPVSMSLDGNFVILSYTYVPKPHVPPSNIYLLLPIRGGRINRPIIFLTSVNEALLNVGLDLEGNPVAFTQKSSNVVGFWKQFSPSSVEITQHFYVNNVWKKKAKPLISSNIALGTSPTNTLIFDTSGFITSLSRRYIFYKGKEFKQWNCLDLNGFKGSFNFALPTNVHVPYEIVQSGRDTFLFTKNFDIYLIRGNKIIQTSGLKHIYGVDKQLGSNQVISLVELSNTNNLDWLSTTLYINGNVPYYGLLNLRKQDLYLNSTLKGNPMYVDLTGNPCATIVNSDQQPGFSPNYSSTSIFTWYFEKYDTIKEVNKIDKWLEKLQYNHTAEK